MVNYIKDVSKHIPFIIIVLVLFYGISTFATGGLFDAGYVKYDNTSSGLTSTNVADAIDELYATSSDYSVYNSSLTTIENKIGTATLNTSAKNLIGAINEIDARFDSNKTLPINKGGTGATTKAAARSNLGVPHTSDIPVPTFQSITYMGLTIVFHKFGRVVNIVIDGTYNSSGSTSAYTSTLKAKVTPANHSYGAIHTDRSGDINLNVLRVTIDTDGNISFSGTNGKIYHGGFSYVCKSDDLLANGL